MNSVKKLLFNRIYKYFLRVSCRIIGLSPWKVNENNIYSVWFVGSYYNFLSSVVLSVFSLGGIFDHPPDPHSLEFSIIVLRRISFITILSTILIPLYYIIRQKQLISVYNRFAKVDKILKKCADFKLRRNWSNRVIFGVNLLTTVFLVVILDACYYPLSLILYGNLPTVIGGGVMIQYAMLLNKIDSRFKSINSVILKISEPKMSVIGPQMMSEIQEFQFHESILYDIDNLQKAYLELYEMCYDAANFYGILMIITILSFGVRIIFSLYAVIVLLCEITKFVMFTWPVIGFRFAWFGFLFVVFTSSTNAMKKQNRKLARTISSLVDHSTLDDKVVEKLSCFSNDLSELEIKLTACDIIPLDRSLLRIVTSTVVVYLAISLQFALLNN